MPYQNHQEEQEDLERQATFLLENPEKAEPQRNEFRPMLRMWQFPSFKNYVCWLISSSRSDDQTFLSRRLEWHRLEDLKKFYDPLEYLKDEYLRAAKEIVPTVEISDTTISAEDFKPYLANLEKIKIIPLLITGNISLDGVGYGFETYHNNNRTKIEWCNSGPEEWQPLEATMMQMLEYLEGHF